MIKGLYTAASGMQASLQKNNIISNNLANINTTGYKKEMTVNKSFSEELVTRMDGEVTDIGQGGSSVVVAGATTDQSTGSFKKTGNKLDWAIEGSGFFTIQTPYGVRYTRNGDFTINKQNQVVTQNGYLVRGEEGILKLPPQSEQVSLKNNKLVVNGEIINKVKLKDFPNKAGLEKAGGTLFRWTPQAGQAFAAQGEIQQGFLEQSNVNVVEEMVKMIANSRKYEANQKMIKAHDNTLGKAVNQVGKA
ncbi:flagellar basal-body rod protein FlgF [Halobacteroides halobius DSM 5150]|uniref:Flagellar basal-body rod protein FlgF n=1 Tax=Halobacteroides halobius (strain ATCC 35273 / DSM 5150 / MD-1) TaxID=748449 RepID=L0KCR4_HALHC|nr:flagellar basal-body rod protein FlgF [Halobacteroides halobius]AGB42325.1 flagellar basal-body rod protein FlgF [Halobacteroides halobius DSM 5150]